MIGRISAGIAVAAIVWRFVFVEILRRRNRRALPSPQPTEFDFHQAESEFLRTHDAGLHESGSLAIRKRGEGGFKIAREADFARWLRCYLISRNCSRFYDLQLANEFASWLASGAEPLPTGTAVKHG